MHYRSKTMQQEIKLSELKTLLISAKNEINSQLKLNKTKDIKLISAPLPKAMLNILNDGGLLAHIEKNGDFKLD